MVHDAPVSSPATSPLSESRSVEPWAPGFAYTPLFTGPLLLVGEWHCSGLQHPWERERARYVQLDVQHEGVHLRWVGRERRVVDATVAGVNAAGDEYRMASPTANPQRCTFVLLRGGLAEELAPRLGARFRAVSPRAALTHARLRRAHDPVAIEEAALSLFRQIVADGASVPAGDAVSGARRALAEEVQHVIATRFAERLTLSSIAEACASSPAHVSRVFREVTGETVHRHLTRVRLRAAMLSLPDAGGRLAQVAVDAGFSSHSHFTQAFRAEFGHPPSAQTARPRPPAGRAHAS
jgi:AraC family transcriptional regulator